MLLIPRAYCSFNCPSVRMIADRGASTIRGEASTMTELLKRLWQEEEGQDLTEYALLLVLISLVAVAAMGALGSAVSDAFSNAATNLTAATTS